MTHYIMDWHVLLNFVLPVFLRILCGWKIRTQSRKQKSPTVWECDSLGCNYSQQSRTCHCSQSQRINRWCKNLELTVLWESPQRWTNYRVQWYTCETVNIYKEIYLPLNTKDLYSDNYVQIRENDLLAL